ncbi:MAG: hypothetical protein MJ137_08670, partial [Clostridia bacterium]|nr:hypothetical protein [Clostridia bacterium]
PRRRSRSSRAGSSRAFFFLPFAAMGGYWNQPLYLGGTGDDGQCIVNPLSHMILDVYDSMNIYNPKLQFKVSEKTPDDFLKKALDMIRRCHNSVVFVNEELTVRALEAAGISPEDARHADIKGCYEYAAPGELITEMFYVNSLKPLEYVLHNGRDGITGEEMGLKTGEPECFGDFGEFFDAYLAQLGALLDRVCEIGNVIESHYTDINPQPLYSATVRECLEKGREAYDGGAKYNNSSLEFGFIATAADSLNAIRKYVYEKKTVTLRQLKDILDADWTGFEPLRRRIMNDPEKYGNNREEPDRIAVRITEFLYGRVVGRPNSPVRGGSWNAGLHVARQYIYQGKKTAATPDGRKAREELSKNASPSQGCGREGATAAILSVTKINAVHLREDVSLDLALLPASVSGNDGLTAMLGLVRTFMRLGGHAVHMNVFDTVMLNDAFQNPDKYRDLQIRVCGWNVLWNNLGSAEQLAYIRQAEALK